MREYPISVLDVFAERPLAGNQLAVVHDAADLTDEQMQAVAREMNFSETTFITRAQAGRASVRIFTPTWELPFAGHPTLGTAWELTQGQGQIVLELKVGDVEVAFADGVGWMTPPQVRFHGEWDVDMAARLIGLQTAAIARDLPVEFAEVGPKFVLIPVARLEDLRLATLDGGLHGRLLEEGLGVQCVYLFCAESYGADADYASRMFFNSAGVREDPATGSANTAFAAYLRRHRGNLGRVVVDQGVEIHRPSRLYLDVNDELRVGGRTHRIMRGQLIPGHG